MKRPFESREAFGAPPTGWRKWLPKGRSDLGIALILLGLIILPSALLGMLTWRSIRNEQTYLEERLIKSYDRVARAAAVEIDGWLRIAGTEWATDLESAAASIEYGGDPGALAGRAAGSGRDSLLAEYFLLPAPGRIAYPPSARAATSGVKGWEPETHRREYETFTDWVSRGEELEYQSGDLAAAIAVYRGIAAEVSSPKLRAIAESYTGRAQLKNGEWEAAHDTFRKLLEQHPEERDLNKMYLRFLAQYQIASAYEGMERPREALDALVELQRDLHRRSDEINAVQFSYYSDLTQTLAARLLSTPELADRSRYDEEFRTLQARIKQDVGTRYLAEVLEAELDRFVVRRREYSPRVRFLSDHAEGEPFLLAYRPLPDRTHTFVTGLIGAEIDLERLRAEMLPTITRHLQPSDEVSLAIRGPAGAVIVGPQRPKTVPIAVQTLAPPFDFWEVAVYLDDVPSAIKKIDLRTTLGLALTVALLLVIVVGATVFTRRARREVFLARARTGFVSNVTHELRTPLSSIRMFAEMLEMELQEKGWPTGVKSRVQWAQYLSLIRKESERLGRLIENVLDFSRIEQRRRHWHFEPRDLGAVVRHAVESFRPHAEASHFRLDLTVTGPLPVLPLDADAMSQVLLNLLSNAVQYSDQVKEIHVRAWAASGAAFIEVADRGIGIAPREVGRVFDEFYSGRQRMDARNPGGLGLGLTLARAIVRAHGGEIRVKSAPGKGSTFTIVLPVRPAAGAPHPEAAPVPLPEMPSIVGETP